MARGRVVPGNGTQHVVTVYGPDRWSVQAASLGVVTNTRSPAASGTPYAGDRGYGLNGNRWTGAGPNPLQAFHGAAIPVLYPQNVGIGMGAGVSGQPGWPYTSSTNAPSALATMSGTPGGRPGLGG